MSLSSVFNLDFQIIFLYFLSVFLSLTLYIFCIYICILYIFVLYLYFVSHFMCIFAYISLLSILVIFIIVFLSACFGKINLLLCFFLLVLQISLVLNCIFIPNIVIYSHVVHSRRMTKIVLAEVLALKTKQMNVFH